MFLVFSVQLYSSIYIQNVIFETCTLNTFCRSHIECVYTKMNKFTKAIETLKRWIGMDKRSGDDRRKKKPRKRKYEKRKAGIKSDRRK